MSRDLNDLKTEFKDKVEILLQRCKDEGYDMRPFFTARSPFEQARLWRQSRSGAKVQAKIKYFRENGAPFLAHCLESVGAQSGRWATNASPGFSWHQWGEAVDCYWLLNGDDEWSTRKKGPGGRNAYRDVYARIAEEVGLVSLGPSLGDWVHVQMRSVSHPGKIYTLQEIDRIMKNTWGD